MASCPPGPRPTCWCPGWAHGQAQGERVLQVLETPSRGERVDYRDEMRRSVQLLDIGEGAHIVLRIGVRPRIGRLSRQVHEGDLEVVRAPPLQVALVIDDVD